MEEGLTDYRRNPTFDLSDNVGTVRAAQEVSLAFPKTRWNVEAHSICTRRLVSKILRK